MQTKDKAGLFLLELYRLWSTTLPQEWLHMFHIIKVSLYTIAHNSKEPPNYNYCKTQFIEEDNKALKKSKRLKEVRPSFRNFSPKAFNNTASH